MSDVWYTIFWRGKLGNFFLQGIVFRAAPAKRDEIARRADRGVRFNSQTMTRGVGNCARAKRMTPCSKQAYAKRGGVSF